MLGSVVSATITPHVVESNIIIIPPSGQPTPTPTASPSSSPSVSPSASPSPSQSASGNETDTHNAKPDFKTGTQGTPVTVSPLGNDTVTAGNVSICDAGSQASSCTDKTVSNSDGDWKVNANGTVTFTPADGFFGKASLGYRVKTASGKIVWSYITVTIPDTSGLAYTGGGDQQAMFAWMLALLGIGATLLRVAKRRS